MSFSVDSVRSHLSHVCQKITKNKLAKALKYLDANVPRKIVYAVHKAIYDIETQANRPTGHRDFGCVALRRIGGFDVPNDVRLAAIQKVQIASEYKSLDTRKQVQKDPVLRKKFEKRTSICRKPEHAHLNGFNNIKIFDATLVPLTTGRFINANFVSMMHSQFIGTQAPLEHTAVDFWQMIVDHKPRSIVAVNDCFDNPKSVTAYCPNEVNEIKRFGDITIELAEPIINETNPDWKLPGHAHVHGIKHRKLIVTQDDQQHTLDHFQYLHWPDAYFPSEPCLTRLIEMVADSQKESQNPIVVHCRAGVGRTGLFMVVYDQLLRLKAGMPLDINQSVTNLRDPKKGRSSSMMQNLPQYEFAVTFLQLQKFVI